MSSNRLQPESCVDNAPFFLHIEVGLKNKYPLVSPPLFANPRRILHDLMKKSILGLYLSEKQAQGVLLEQDNSSSKLFTAAEWSNSLFDYAGDDTPGVDDFVEHLSRFVTTQKLSTPLRVSVTLDTSLLFISTIPFGSTVSRSEIDDQIQWELRTHFPDAPANSFISDIHILTRPRSDEGDEVLMVSVRSDLVRKIHRSLARLNLRVDVVDCDHFSADTALRYNHSEAASRFVALVGLKPQRIDLTLIRYFDTESYSYAMVRSDQEVVQHIRRIVDEKKDLSSIVVYGKVANDLLAHVRNAIGIPVEKLNPLRCVELAGAAWSDAALKESAANYVSAIGVALRRD